jgi:hypothetical protein
MYNNREYVPKNIAGAATTNVFTGKGILGRITINSVGTGGTITVTDQSSPVINIALITLSGSPFTTLDYDATIANGLTVVTSASPNITVMWAKD